MADVVSRDDSFEVAVPIAKRDRARQIAYGVVLEPRDASNPDLQGDWHSAEDVEKAAHRFLAHVANGEGFGDHMHDRQTKAGYPVESFIAPVDFTLGDQLVKRGSWVMGMHYPDPNIWKGIVDGRYSAFSVGGYGRRV